MKEIVVALAIACFFISIPADDKLSTNKKIDWYPVLNAGLAEAKRTGKPILLLSAAPQCLGVPGIW